MKIKLVIIFLVFLIFFVAFIILQIKVNRVVSNYDSLKTEYKHQVDSSIKTSKRLNELIAQKEYLNIHLLRLQYQNAYYKYVEINYNNLNTTKYNFKGKITPQDTTPNHNPLKVYYGSKSYDSWEAPYPKSGYGVLLTTNDQNKSDYYVCYMQEADSIVKINGVILDFNNEVVLWIKNNYWYARINEKYKIISTSNSVKITDSDGDIIADIKLIDNNTVYFQGLIQNDDSFIYYWKNYKLVFDNDSSSKAYIKEFLKLNSKHK